MAHPKQDMLTNNDEIDISLFSPAYIINTIPRFDIYLNGHSSITNAAKIITIITS